MAYSLSHSSPYQSAVHPFPSMARPAVLRAHGPQTVSSEPNYLARRALAALVAFIAVTMLFAAFILLAGLGGRPASASQAEPATSNHASVYVAAAGESLWSIAEAHRGDVQIDRYVDALIDLNGGTDVQIGQAIQLP
jgi:hypothetical protein